MPKTASLMGKVLKASLDDLFAKMRSDEVWGSGRGVVDK